MLPMIACESNFIEQEAINILMDFLGRDLLGSAIQFEMLAQHIMKLVLCSTLYIPLHSIH